MMTDSRSASSRKVKMRIHDFSPEDRLSILPLNVIEAILLCLPLKEAVRTSILSRFWRYEWSNRPQLVFDSNTFPYDMNQPQMEYDSRVVKIIDQVIILHQGPVHMFKLSTDMASCIDIDRWITFLSRNGIREFIFEKWRGEKYKMHSCLFTCKELNYLEMSGSILIPHASFSGPMNLKALVLENVSFSNNGLNNLIYNCPLLNTLTLRDIIGCTHLKLCAPNLVDLTVDCACIYISLEETPVLANVYIDLLEHEEGNQNYTNGATCKLIDILGGLPAIRSLDLIARTYQTLSAGHSPVRLPSACPLSYLFININFGDMRQLLAALCIFRSSSLLWKVDIKSISHPRTEEKSIEEFWEAQKDSNGLFSQLQILSVYEFMGTKAEMKFIEFVLANAPVLELVYVAFEQGVDETKILRKLVRLRRISSKVEIEVPEETVTID